MEKISYLHSFGLDEPQLLDTIGVAKNYCMAQLIFLHSKTAGHERCIGSGH